MKTVFQYKFDSRNDPEHVLQIRVDDGVAKLDMMRRDEITGHWVPRELLPMIVREGKVAYQRVDCSGDPSRYPSEATLYFPDAADGEHGDEKDLLVKMLRDAWEAGKTFALGGQAHYSFHDWLERYRLAQPYIRLGHSGAKS